MHDETLPPIVAVTGAGGAIGRIIVHNLRRTGFRVRAISRKDRKWEDPGIEAAVLPHFDDPPENFDASLAGAAHVVHGAGLSNASPKTTEQEYMQANALLTGRLAEAAAGTTPGRFIFLSSIRAAVGAGYSGVVGPATPAEPVCAYGRSKRAAELEALERFAAIDLSRLSILRLPPVYGPSAKGNLEKMLRLADTPYPLPDLRNRRSLLSAAALADAVVDLLGMPLMRQIYVASDRLPVSVGDIFAAFRSGLDRPKRLLPVPPVVLHTALKLVGHGKDWQGLFSEQLCDSSALVDDGWRQVDDPRPGLADLARSFQKPGA